MLSVHIYHTEPACGILPAVFDLFNSDCMTLRRCVQMLSRFDLAQTAKFETHRTCLDVACTLLGGIQDMVLQTSSQCTGQEKPSVAPFIVEDVYWMQSSTRLFQNRLSQMPPPYLQDETNIVQKGTTVISVWRPLAINHDKSFCA